MRVVLSPWFSGLLALFVGVVWFVSPSSSHPTPKLDCCMGGCVDLKGSGAVKVEGI